MWNPVKELKVEHAASTPKIDGPWNPVKELKAHEEEGLVTPIKDGVESGEGIERSFGVNEQRVAELIGGIR